METNLARLCHELEIYAESQNSPGLKQSPGASKRLSRALFLANSSSRTTFPLICESGSLVSQEIAAKMKGIAVNPNTCEAIMGTEGDVFFYVGPFRYPSTACGLLFATTLENIQTDEGAAAPFDSGGLLHHIMRSDPNEPPREFLSRHELPIPQHREYLEHSLRLTFGSPTDYVDGVEPLLAGALGLSGGDSRRWTHEVRLPNRVYIRTAHLQAVFATRTVVVEPTGAVERLFKWCARQGVDTVAFDHPKNGNFEELRRQSIEYIRRKLY
jgi:hypothetical protein